MMNRLTKILVMLLVAVATSFANWTGTSSEPESIKKIDGKSFYVITTPEELAGFAALVNGGQTEVNAILANDIVFGTDENTVGTKSWTPIGKDTTLQFSGILDGAGYTIYGLKGFSGLVYCLGENGVLKNFKMASGQIFISSYAGGVVAINNGLIQNVVNQNHLVGSNGKIHYAGGLTGYNKGTIIDCNNKGNILDTVSSSYSSYSYLGGIAGYSFYGKISNCNNSGIITSNRHSKSSLTDAVDTVYSASGGIAGYMWYGSISVCNNTGSIYSYSSSEAISTRGDKSARSKAFSYSGGIVGYNRGYGDVLKCYNAGDIHANSTSNALLGYYSSSSSYSVGDSRYTQATSVAYSGGIVGYNDYVIRDCFNKGSSYASSSVTSRYYQITKDSYGNVSGYTLSSGQTDKRENHDGIVGYNDFFTRYSFDIKSNTYWLNNTSVSSSAESMQRDQFAWILNTCNGSEENSGVWTRGSEGYPTFANEDSLPIYRVIFDDDGTTLTRYTNYLGYVTFPNDPEPATGYLFTGWYNADDIRVKSTTKFSADQTVNAVYADASDVYWNISFYNADSTLLDTLIAQHGSIVSYRGGTPTIPATAQYTFSFAGWNVEPTNATENFDYYAVYDSTVNSYKVVFQDYDGTELQSSTYEYGKTPGYASSLTRSSTAEWNYTHAGWTPAIESVTGAATYTAIYDSTKVEYTVTFMNGTTILESQQVPYGSAANPSVIPTRSGYKFVGWNSSFNNVTADLTVKALFEELIYHTVSAKTEDGESIGNVDVAENESYTLPDAPEKTGYTFSGWYDGDGKYLGTVGIQITISDDITIEARYTANTYTITFADEDGTELSKSSVTYGMIPTAPADPTKASTVQYSYEFAGWSPAIVSVTRNANYVATYTSKICSYTITFVNEDGIVIDSVSEDYGSVPTAPADPTKASTAQYTYEFAGWTPEIAKVSGNATYTATYNSTVNSYTITFVDEDGTELSKSTVVYGRTPAAPADPEKASTAQYTYEFAGWTPEVTTVKGNATYTATYNSTVNSYTITFVDEDGTEISKSSVIYGRTPTAPADPEKASTAQYTYEFAGWTPEITKVTGNATYTATYNSTLNAYKVTFLDYDGTALKTQNVRYGNAAMAPADPERDGYEFTGWDKEFDNIVANTEVTALYEELSSSSAAKSSSSSSVESSSSSIKSSSSSAKSSSSSSAKSSSSSVKSSSSAKSSSSSAKSSSSEKENAIAEIANAPLFSIEIIGRTLQIGAAEMGKTYAIADMQGRVLKSGYVNAANFNIALPNAGSYLVRVGNQTRRVNIK